MSDDLYSTRLRWSGGFAGQGAAKLRGQPLRLAEAPQISGVHVWEIDYHPEVRSGRIKPHFRDDKRDMTDDEIAQTDKLLEQLLRETREAQDRGASGP